MSPERRRSALWPFTAGWCLLVGGLAYAMFLHEYEVPNIEVPCRTPDGQVWPYRYSTGGEWGTSLHDVGEDVERRQWSAETPGLLDCNPSRIARGDLERLENGVVESVELSEQGGTWSFVLQDEMRGRFTYRYTYLDGQVSAVRGSRRFVSLLTYGGFWVFVFGGWAAIIRQAANHRRRAGGGHRG